RPISVERPGASPRFDGLPIVPHLVVRSGQCREPDEQTGITGTEPDALFCSPDRLFPPPSVKVHLCQKHVDDGKARVEPDRQLECRNRALKTLRPHASQTKSKMGVGIARVQYNGPLREIASLLKTSIGIVGPPCHSRAG